MLNLTRLLGCQSGLTIARHETGSGYGPVVVWKATRTCNLPCVRCYSGGEPRRFAGELSTEEAQRMIEDLVAFNVSEIVFAGGEPFTRADIFDLADFATSLGMRVSFSTNGTLLDPQKIQRLRSAGVNLVEIALEGTEERHDQMRGSAGAFGAAIRAIRGCRDAGIPTGIRFTPTTFNIDDLEEIFRIVEEENVARLCIAHLVYAGDGSYLSAMDLSAVEKRRMMSRLIEQVEAWDERARDIEVVTSGNDADGPFIYLRLRDRSETKADFVLSLIKSGGGNRSGVGIAAIDSFGYVLPDPDTTHHVLGSIRVRPFSEIWRDPRVELLQGLRERRTLLSGRCATCRWITACNGNCRARAEAEFGNYWDSDPACYLLDSEVASAGS